MQSQKSQFVRKKLKKYENKYHMFHEPHPHASKPDSKLILDSITKLTTHLDSEGFTPKLVVAADYLTTFYQLLHLRDKY